MVEGGIVESVEFAVTYVPLVGISVPSIRTAVKVRVRYFSICVSARVRAVPFWPARRSETALEVNTARRAPTAIESIVIAISSSMRPNPSSSAARRLNRREQFAAKAAMST